MKNKKVMKIVSFIVILLTIAMVAMPVFAAAADNGVSMDPNSYTKGTPSNLSNSTNKIMGNILGVIQIVAMFLAVIMLIVLAVKYFSAAPQEKADIKKSLTLYVVGAVLLFGASGILQIIKSFAGTIQE